MNKKYESIHKYNYFRMSDVKQRIQNKKAIVRGPVYSSPLNAYGGRVIDMSDEEIMNILNAVLLKNPNDIGALLERARRYEESNNFDGAVKDYQSVLVLDPENTQASEAIRFYSQSLFSHTAAHRSTYARLY